ncbi:MAG TPA: hypothetical protein VG722_03830 [Tepidisphaeraceae bacterium]|nr:hypothetical protein [Tepidisphaeraceae bacterium]
MFLAVAFIRRQFFRVESYPKQGFTIAELRKLRDSGQISATEYDKAKMLLLNEQGQATKPNDKNQP